MNKESMVIKILEDYWKKIGAYSSIVHSHISHTIGDCVYYWAKDEGDNEYEVAAHNNDPYNIVYYRNLADNQDDWFCTAGEEVVFYYGRPYVAPRPIPLDKATHIDIKENDKIVRSDGCKGRVIATRTATTISAPVGAVCYATFADGTTCWVKQEEIYSVGHTLVGNMMPPQILEEKIEQQRREIEQVQTQVLEPARARLQQLRKQLWYMNNYMGGEKTPSDNINNGEDDIQ